MTYFFYLNGMHFLGLALCRRYANKNMLLSHIYYISHTQVLLLLVTDTNKKAR